jgi:hypothetical protein
MNARLRRGICVVAVAAAFASQALAATVVSSFKIDDIGAAKATGIYRDWDYVYGVLSSGGQDYLTTYTTDGSLVRSVALTRANSPRDADHSELGSGYFDVFDYGRKMLVTYKKSGGFVKEKPLPSDTTAYAYVRDSSRYFIARDQMIFRYTTNDVLVNKFYVGGDIGGLAASPVYDGKNGEYVIIGRAGAGGYSYVYTGGGSLVDSFVVPGVGTYASVVGRAEPKELQRTYWCVQGIGSARWAFQVEIEGTAPAVEPGSIGKLKALYR